MSKSRIAQYLFYLIGGLFLIKYFICYVAVFAVFGMGSFVMGGQVMIIRKLKKICKILQENKEKS